MVLPVRALALSVALVEIDVLRAVQADGQVQAIEALLLQVHMDNALDDLA